MRPFSRVLAAGLLLSTGLLSAAGLHFQTNVLPQAAAGRKYVAFVRTAGGTRCLNSDRRLAFSGELPRGLAVTPDGLEGVPEQTGSWKLSVTLFNDCESIHQDFNLVVGGRPILSVSKEEIRITVEKGANNRTSFLVNADWEKLDYRLVTAGGPWLRLSATGGLTPSKFSALTGDQITVESSSTNLEPGTYRDRIQVFSPGATNVPEIDVVMTVVPASPSGL
ncbi:MAG: hypothetical protein H7039_06200 [Bryobacteraceae bacterium]|nr:hypothetical protein [Bryobacteraceae bacterium]